MSKRRKIIISILLVGLWLGTMVTWRWHSRLPAEPAYQGIKLSDWVVHLGNRPDRYVPYVPTNDFFSSNGARLRMMVGNWRPSDPLAEQAPEAIRQMRREALPCLLKWITYEEPPPWRKKLNATLRDFKLTKGLVPDPRVGEKRRNVASTTPLAFEFLGPEGEKAIGALAEILRKPRSEEVTYRAVGALAAVGADGLPHLIQGLEARDPVVRLACVKLFDRFQSNAAPAIPPLLRCLRDPDLHVRAEATRVVGVAAFQARQSDRVIPALMDQLQDREPQVRQEAAMVLRIFRNDAAGAAPRLIDLLKDKDVFVKMYAASALGGLTSRQQLVVPALMKALNDTESGVRVVATEALRQMAPEALTNAPSR